MRLVVLTVAVAVLTLPGTPALAQVTGPQQAPTTPPPTTRDSNAPPTDGVAGGQNRMAGTASLASKALQTDPSVVRLDEALTASVCASRHGTVVRVEGVRHCRLPAPATQ